MTFKDMLSMSIGNLWRRKLRTFLTVLGVLIGTISIVAMLSIALGMKAMIVEEYSSYGSATQITVTSNDESKGSVDYLTGDTTVENISNIEHVKAVYPILNGYVDITAGRYQESEQIYAIPSELLEAIEIEDGEMPSSEGGQLEFIAGNATVTDWCDVQNDYSYVYYDTGELADVDLFSKALQFTMYNDNAYVDTSTTSDSGDGTVDDSSYVDNSNVTLRAKVTALMAGGPEAYNNQYSYGMICDIEAYKNYLKKNFKKGYMPGQPKDNNGKAYNEWIYSNILVEVDEAANVDDVQSTISEMGLYAESNKELLESAQSTVRIIELVLGAIGGIAFLVAAIGIANTMMMSTYERTKEIGVMKVLGCDMRDIMALFLAEAGCIGFIGGVTGTILTKVLSMAANFALASSIGASMGVSSAKISVVPLWLIIVAIIFSTLMGMIAGFFPARRAMKLSPLAAIRNE